MGPIDVTKLSPREREIARLLARGLANKAIAQELGISAFTVSSHLRRLFAKLDVGTRAGAVGVVVRSEVAVHNHCTGVTGRSWEHM
jgi:DNA-binding CsgD family transcriptional regulator